MTGAEHYSEAQKRIGAADYKWQDTHDVTTALGAVYEAILANAHATLALAAAVEKQTGLAHGVDSPGYGR